ncbi:hypothetical protein HMPREF9372_3373 [Sporosarcina newyorkensis 2681]|uniref:Uncharacterized protein n=1 Tax=Sporosarcina newyorkensis 2681 TaxID=1027292 RepID=F9DX42_9BACL|nr:hypothetical protein [Sporosarcina newyorkensis]EGQ21090.1 hypothetical protein HMPREF9372_3373 [Sporosarcina newyorkensis 2681]
MKSLQEQLIEKGLVQPVKQVEPKKDTRTNKKRNEQLSERELADLMGIRRPVYGRGKGGAYRQR